jgi:hypothetical protein
VFALDGAIYALYLPAANPSGVLLVENNRQYQLHWYNPRTGKFEGESPILTSGNQGLPLGAPPAQPDEDWVALVTAVVDTAGSTLSASD